MSRHKKSYSKVSAPTPIPKEPDFESGKDVLLNIEEPNGSTTIRA
jgi:hypothetical protein